jgi:hypothetical protein
MVGRSNRHNQYYRVTNIVTIEGCKQNQFSAASPTTITYYCKNTWGSNLLFLIKFKNDAIKNLGTNNEIKCFTINVRHFFI